MPIVTTQYKVNGVSAPVALQLDGPRIRVLVAPPPAKNAQNAAAEISASGKLMWALIDTGADHGCIDEKVATDLGLRIVDRQKICGVGGERDHNFYLGSLFVQALESAFIGALIGVSLDERTPVILGRDFLRDKLMFYDGKNGSIIVTC